MDKFQFSYKYFIYYSMYPLKYNFLGYNRDKLIMKFRISALLPPLGSPIFINKKLHSLIINST